MTETRTYFAISIFNSRTFYLNTAALLVAILSATEVATIVPPKYMPIYGAILASLNIWLRMNTVRPAILIPPGETQPMLVKKVGPPDPPKMGD